MTHSPSPVPVRTPAATPRLHSMLQSLHPPRHHSTGTKRQSGCSSASSASSRTTSRVRMAASTGSVPEKDNHKDDDQTNAKRVTKNHNGPKTNKTNRRMILTRARSKPNVTSGSTTTTKQQRYLLLPLEDPDCTSTSATDDDDDLFLWSSNPSLGGGGEEKVALVQDQPPEQRPIVPKSPARSRRVTTISAPSSSPSPSPLPRRRCRSLSANPKQDDDDKTLSTTITIKKRFQSPFSRHRSRSRSRSCAQSSTNAPRQGSTTTKPTRTSPTKPQRSSTGASCTPSSRPSSMSRGDSRRRRSLVLNVTWATRTVYEFGTILGHHPAVSDGGIPLTLDWQVQECTVTRILGGRSKTTKQDTSTPTNASPHQATPPTTTVSTTTTTPRRHNKNRTKGEEVMARMDGLTQCIVPRLDAGTRLARYVIDATWMGVVRMWFVVFAFTGLLFISDISCCILADCFLWVIPCRKLFKWPKKSTTFKTVDVPSSLAATTIVLRLS